MNTSRNTPQTIEVTGDDIESAIQDGLQTLGVGRENVMIVVLEEPVRRMLGLGSTPARVQLTVIAAPKPAVVVKPVEAETNSVALETPKPRRPGRPRKVTEAETALAEPIVEPVIVPDVTADALADDLLDPATETPRTARPVREDRNQDRGQDRNYRPDRSADRTSERSDDEYAHDNAPVTEEQLAEDAKVGAQVLETLLAKMNVNATVTPSPARLEEEEAQHWTLQVNGPNLGRLIGRKGETLASLQYITRLIVSKEIGRRANLVIDIEGFKARREDQLRRLASTLAQQAIQTGRMVAMEPMPPSERRIIHITLRAHPDVTTESIGEGDRRKVTIMPKRTR